MPHGGPCGWLPLSNKTICNGRIHRPSQKTNIVNKKDCNMNILTKICMPIRVYLIIRRLTPPPAHTHHTWVMPWLRRLVAGLSPRRPGFDPGPCGTCGGQSGHRCSINWKIRKKLTVFITGLQNKPQGYGASVASAARALQHTDTPYVIIKSLFYLTIISRHFPSAVLSY
jgi:hypothetical protein